VGARPRRSAGWPVKACRAERFVEDLSTILSGKRAAYFAAGPSGAILALKSGEVVAFSQIRQDRVWTRLSGLERAETLAGWIRRAAATCREGGLRIDRNREFIP
jgi:hypothetical protein